MTVDGPIVEDVRRRAMQLSERFGHDLRKYVEHLKEIEEKHRSRVGNQITVVKADNQDNEDE